MSIAAIESSILDAQRSYYRLVLLVGANGMEKTQYLKLLAQKAGYPYINLGMELSKKLLEYSSKQRQFESFKQVNYILEQDEQPILLIDHIEILFDPDLMLEPLGLLKRISRHRILVVAWPGNYRDSSLDYAEQGHREYKKYKDIEAIILEV